MRLHCLNIQQKQQGFTIVELMIAMTLGALLLAGLTQIFVSNKQTFSKTQSYGQVEENGRFAMLFLVKQLRKGGLSPMDTLSNKEEKPNPFLAAGKCTPSEKWCTENGKNATDSDKVAVQFDGTGDTDCNGNAVAGNKNIVNVFWVQEDKSNDNIRTLYCEGFYSDSHKSLGTAQPLVPGIETLQLLYGEITNSGETPTRYVSADRVSNWAKVKSVRVGLIAQSAGSEVGKTLTRKYALLDAGIFTYKDKYPRAIYQTTVSLENMTTFKGL